MNERVLIFSQEMPKKYASVRFFGNDHLLNLLINK